MANAAVRAEAFLPDLINTCILQYSKSHSVSDTISVLNSAFELNIHRLDPQVLAEPLPGMGHTHLRLHRTVVGIADALNKMDINKFMGAQSDKVLQFKAVTADLGFAFGTTIVALVLSAVLVFLMNIVQKGEGRS